MARVHMFKSSFDKQKEAVLLSEQDELPSSPSLITTEETNSSSLDVTTCSTNNQQEQLNRTENAALTAALLQKASNVAAVLSVKPDSLEMLSEKSQQELLTTLQQHQQQQQQDEADVIHVDTLQEQPKTNNSNNNNEFMDQAAAATALQLLGLAQENKVTATLDGNVMMIDNYAGSNTDELNQKRGAWTREEDDLLLTGIKKFGYGRWKEIASIIPGRKGKQLKQRWDNTLASKYVDQEWLQNKIRDQIDVRQQPTTTTTITELADWTTIAQKISEKIKQGDQVAIESLISQALISTINSVATSSGSGSGSTTFNDPSSLALFTPPPPPPPPQQQQNQTLDNSTAGGNSNHRHQFFIPAPPPPTTTTTKKRKRSDPALADTQSDAMSIYASATPITTTVNNQTQTFYPCLFPDCGKTFARLYNLKSHSRTHTDDRPFICQSCHIAFSRNHDLKRHSKIHGGDKPFQCAGCSKTFSRLDALKRHRNNQRNKATCVNAPIIQ